MVSMTVQLLIGSIIYECKKLSLSFHLIKKTDRMSMCVCVCVYVYIYICVYLSISDPKSLVFSPSSVY